MSVLILRSVTIVQIDQFIFTHIEANMFKVNLIKDRSTNGVFQEVDTYSRYGRYELKVRFTKTS